MNYSTEKLENLFKDVDSEEYIVIQKKGRMCRYWKKDRQGNKAVLISYLENSRQNRMLTNALTVLGKKGFDEPMEKEEFKNMVVKDDHGLDSSDVNSWLKRKSARFF